MYGAILGDVVGSVFEFDRGPWTKEFEFITRKSCWTDDTVMTIAIAEALMAVGRDADGVEMKEACIKSMRKWGNKYPNAGYGGRFYRWLFSSAEPKPYGSWGNGSAMRVSAVGWLYDTIDKTREVARLTAEVTHSHPEGIKGAECAAAVIFLGRHGATQNEIKEYVAHEFGYDFSKTAKELIPFHKHDESCMDALPKALTAFFEGKSLEDTIRNAVALGGDTDTIAAIAGGMAEAFFGISAEEKHMCYEKIEADMREVLLRFEDKRGQAISKGSCV